MREERERNRTSWSFSESRIASQAEITTSKTVMMDSVMFAVSRASCVSHSSDSSVTPIARSEERHSADIRTRSTTASTSNLST